MHNSLNPFIALACAVLLSACSAKTTGGDSSAQLSPHADPTALTSTDKEAFTFGKTLLTPLLTMCDGRTILMAATGDRGAAINLIEIKEPTFEINSEGVSDADKLNGIDYIGIVNMRWKVFRIVQHGKWSNWMDTGADVPFVSVAGVENTHVVHERGEWSKGHYYGDSVALKRKPISCDALPKAAA